MDDWNEDKLQDLEDNLSKCQWETKEGVLISFGKMSAAHITNCINYITTAGLNIEYATFSDYIDAFNTELEKRKNDTKELLKILSYKENEPDADINRESHDQKGDN